MASLSEVESRSWVHVERVETATGPVVRVEGWIFAEAGEPISQVRAVASPHSWSAAYPLPRPDVAAAFPASPQAKASGFAIQLRDAPPARFQLNLEARTLTQDWTVFFRTKVEPARAAVLTDLPHPGFYLWFDAPRDWAKLTRRFHLSGWCFCRNGDPIDAIRVRIGTREFPGSYGIFRADVAQTHGESPSTFKSGFDIIVEAPRGRATLVLEVQHTDGAWREIFSKKIRAPLINLRRISDAQLWEIGDYATWIKRYDVLRSSDRAEIRAHIERFAATPLISIVMPVYNPSPAHLRAAIESVRDSALSALGTLRGERRLALQTRSTGFLPVTPEMRRTHQSSTPGGERRDCRRLERRACPNDRRFRRPPRRRRRARAAALYFRRPRNQPRIRTRN